jgi:tetratricopeptide (TPR) repeat protein
VRPCLSGFDVALTVAGSAGDDVQRHANECARCRRLVDITERLHAASLDPRALSSAGEEVEALVAELLMIPAVDRLPAAQADRYLLVGVAGRFSALARVELNRDLNIALDHACVATAIVARMTRTGGRVAAELEFDAWKNRGTVHCFRGEHDEARESLTRARAGIERCTDRELRRAIADYAEAMLCAERDVWEPQLALRLLDSCEPVFAVRDVSRLASVAAMRGIVHLRTKDYASAHAVFVSVANTIPADREAERNDSLRNVASSLVGLRRFVEALDLLQRVRGTDARLGRTLMVVRDDALAAEVAQARGDYEFGAEMFAQARRRFASAGEFESALLCGKSQAVCLVGADKVAEACVVLRDLLGTSVTSDSDRRRFTADALAYLRDLAERERLTLDIASGVGSFIDRIHVQRARPFLPPMSAHTM